MLVTFLSVCLALVYLGYETRWFSVRLAAVPREYSLHLLPSDPRRIVCAAGIFLIFVSLSPLMIKELLFRMPSPSESFDCDDSVSHMMDAFNRLGISATPILGNLHLDDYEYWESNHVWVIAEIGPWNIPFDWGTIGIGEAYFRGYPISPQELAFFVLQDSLPRDEDGNTILPAENR